MSKSSDLQQDYMQNRELSWLDFNLRVLDQGASSSVPLLERLNFVGIFQSNLQEFFMVRVGSLTDLSLLKTPLIDAKSGMTPAQQLSAIYARCHELYPIQERIYEDLRGQLAQAGLSHLRPDELNDEQRGYLKEYFDGAIMPFLAAQIINSRHPFPHLENGAVYVVVRLDDSANPAPAIKEKGKKSQAKGGAVDAILGLVPLPKQCPRIIPVPGKGYQFVLLEHVIEMFVPDIFSMYTVKHTNIICVTRNADLDTTEGADEVEEDYREHMKRILKKRGHLQPVRLESEQPLSSTVSKLLLDRLNLQKHQVFVTKVPLDLGFIYSLDGHVPQKRREELTYASFTPQWPACLDRSRSIMSQVEEHEVLLQYPYESMDPFILLLREAANDPQVVAIKITLYRLASQSKIAEALIAAAENGKEVTALFELRARFDESNNINWSQRFEEAGCRVLYGFRQQKVHSKICCITRQTDQGLEYITQVGTGNYNEKTARLYTDFCFMTTNPAFGKDAVMFFRNMALENLSDDYDILLVAPLQIKPRIIAGIDRQIERARQGLPSRLIFKTNSITDYQIIQKLAEAGQAGVPTTLFVRGISCIVPGIPGATPNVRVVSIVGRLLEHSRIYLFGVGDDTQVFLSSADLMTRNMDKRVEVAWPVLNAQLRDQVVEYLETSFKDTAKLRELRPDATYTSLKVENPEGEPLFDSQDFFIQKAKHDHIVATAEQERTRSNAVAAEAEAEAPASSAPSHDVGAESPASPAGQAASQQKAATDAAPEASASKGAAQPGQTHLELSEVTANTAGDTHQGVGRAAAKSAAALGKSIFGFAKALVARKRR